MERRMHREGTAQRRRLAAMQMTMQMTGRILGKITKYYQDVS
jgi:hypothetical protein